MSLRSLFPLLALAACNGGDPSSDDTDDTVDSEETDVAGDTDGAGGDTDATETDETDVAGIATSWTGTWSYTWVEYFQDLDYPGPGQLWEPRDSSCTAGTLSLTIEADGTIVMSAPYGVCTAGTQQGWTVMTLDAALTEGTTDVAGEALFGNLGGPGVLAISGIPVTGSIGADGEVANGLLTLTGSQVNNGEQPNFNRSFQATLRPAAR